MDIPTISVDSIMVYGLMKQLAPFLPQQMYFASSGWDAMAVLNGEPIKSR